MNCDRAREHLPLLVYGDLAPEDAVAVENHLEGCPACRNELAALRQLRQALDAVPEPVVRVDLPRLYARAAWERERQVRRWRRMALAFGAVAALVLLAFGLKLEVRVQAHEVTLTWGRPALPEKPPSAPPKPLPPGRSEGDAVLVQVEDLKLLRELIHAVASDVEAREQQERESLARLGDRLDALELQSRSRWAATEKDVAALYTAQFGPREKGVRP
jgi:hypothetical protein